MGLLSVRPPCFADAVGFGFAMVCPCMLTRRHSGLEIGKARGGESFSCLGHVSRYDQPFPPGIPCRCEFMTKKTFVIESIHEFIRSGLMELPDAFWLQARHVLFPDRSEALWLTIDALDT